MTEKQVVLLNFKVSPMRTRKKSRVTDVNKRDNIKAINRKKTKKIHQRHCFGIVFITTEFNSQNWHVESGANAHLTPK